MQLCVSTVLAVSRVKYKSSGLIKQRVKVNKNRVKQTEAITAYFYRISEDTLTLQ